MEASQEMKCPDCGKNFVIKIGISFVIALIIFGLMNLACYIWVENQQWLKNPDVRYDWWQFLLFWDNAFAWLFYANYLVWVWVAVTYSTIIGFLFAIGLMGEKR
jgi:hypothetical protein